MLMDARIGKPSAFAYYKFMLLRNSSSDLAHQPKELFEIQEYETHFTSEKDSRSFIATPITFFRRSIWKPYNGC